MADRQLQESPIFFRIPPTQPSMRGFINGTGIGDTVEREHEETEGVDESNRRTIEE